jgi:hypothetical protein
VTGRGQATAELRNQTITAATSLLHTLSIATSNAIEKPTIPIYLQQPAPHPPPLPDKHDRQRSAQERAHHDQKLPQPHAARHFVYIEAVIRCPLLARRRLPAAAAAAAGRVLAPLRARGGGGGAAAAAGRRVRRVCRCAGARGAERQVCSIRHRPAGLYLDLVGWVELSVGLIAEKQGSRPLPLQLVATNALFDPTAPLHQPTSYVPASLLGQHDRCSE